MKINNFKLLVLFGMLAVIFSTQVKAQEQMPPFQENTQKKRPNLLAELDLSPDQIQQIRRFNQDNRIKRQEAQQRVRSAQQSLDEAIYADAANEAELQARLKNLQLAHAEVIRLRALTEFNIRKILSPEQLVKFREIRQTFTENMEDRLNKPKNRRFNNPNKPFNNRQRRLRPNI